MTADIGQLAALARLEALRHQPRTPERRAAAHLAVALSEAKTVDAARRMLATFTTPQVRAAALQLLGRLEEGTPA